jgi:hypothetical protein
MPRTEATRRGREKAETAWNRALVLCDWDGFIEGDYDVLVEDDVPQEAPGEGGLLEKRNLIEFP